MAAIIVMSKAFVSYLVLCSTLPVIKSAGIDIGLCSSNSVACQCGDPGYIVQIPVKLCTFFRKFKPYCRPCDVESSFSTDHMCAKYKNCQDCKPHLKGCSACPPNRFGTWCTGECKCQNGGTCNSYDGKCICRSGFKGSHCQMYIGCVPPAISFPLLESRVPLDSPFYIEYQCSPGYKLIGLSRLTCLPSKQWSSALPKCARLCEVPKAPSNGRVHPQSGSFIVEGEAINFLCDKGYALVGSNNAMCSPNTSESMHVPTCDKLVICVDPGLVDNSRREVYSLHSLDDNLFVAGTRVVYSCKDEFILLGSAVLLCDIDGSWLHELPSCVKVSPVTADCTTRGSDVYEDFGIPVRIECPPECSGSAEVVWGTVIYEESSAVCPAAIHSGVIGNTGGSVNVVYNGLHTYFLASQMNRITSKGLQGSGRSFRFHYINTNESKSDIDRGCPQNWVQLHEDLCALVVLQARTWDFASGICRNLGVHLSVAVDGDVDLSNLTLELRAKSVKEAWVQILNLNESSFNSSTEDDDEETCPLLMLEEKSSIEQRSCVQKFPFVCLRSLSEKIERCNDPGSLEHGTVIINGHRHQDGFSVGSTLSFSCDALYYLRGPFEITCNSSLTWSNNKAECVRITTCPEPMSIPFGYVETFRPSKNDVHRRKAVVLPSMHAIAQHQLPPPDTPWHGNTFEMSRLNLTIPAGYHVVGSRAVYSCHSRYYTLVGSQTRRCQNDGQWSGRVASCIPVCGRSDSPRTPFITNGNATEMGQWPWQAAISQWLSDYNLWFTVCGGALLNERWVVTAAHCVTYSSSNILVPPAEMRVHLGKYYRSDDRNDEYIQMIKAKELFVHPDYDPNLYDADIALVELKQAAVLTSRVQPVCLPTLSSTRRNIIPGKMGVVIGWGLTENATYGEFLRQAVIPVVSDEICRKSYEEVKVLLTITENMFCAGYNNSMTDTCSGDSGGPIVFSDDSGSERRWVLEGIVSWGSPNGCGKPNQYGGYTIVSRFLEWINYFI